MFEYETIPLHWVNRLGFLVRKELALRFRAEGYDIGAEDWAVLLILWKKGPQTPGALADVTFRDRTTITRLIDGMVKKDLVTRREDAKDRRRSLVDITPYAFDLQGELVPIAHQVIAGAMPGVSHADLEATTRTLRRMTENLVGDPSKSKPTKPMEKQNG